MSNKIKIIVNNGYMYSVITKVISVATGLLYAILYSRYLGAELKGIASVISNYSEMIMLVLCFGVYQAYPFYKKKTGKVTLYKEFIDNIFGLFFLYCIFATVLIVVFELEINVKVIIILIPIMMATRQLNYLVMIENPKARNTTQVLIDCLDVIIIFGLMLLTKANLFYCILFLITKNIVWLIFSIINLNINILSIRPSLKGIFKYIQYGFIPMLTIIMMEINYKVDVLMLERMGALTSQIGVYTVGVMIAQKLWLIPDALKDILTSKLAKGKSISEVCMVARLSSAVMIVCILIIAVCGNNLIYFLFGQDFKDAYKIFLIVAAGSLGMVFYKMIYAFNVVNGHKTINFFLLFIAALINVVLNWILIPRMSIVGAGIASLVSYSICGLSFLITFCYKNSVSIKELLFVNKSDIKRVISIVIK